VWIELTELIELIELQRGPCPPSNAYDVVLSANPFKAAKN